MTQKQIIQELCKGCNCHERMKTEQQPFISVITIENYKDKRDQCVEKRKLSEIIPGGLLIV